MAVDRGDSPIKFNFHECSEKSQHGTYMTTSPSYGLLLSVSYAQWNDELLALYCGYVYPFNSDAITGDATELHKRLRSVEDFFPKLNDGERIIGIADDIDESNIKVFTQISEGVKV